MTTRSEDYHNHEAPAYDAKYDEIPFFTEIYQNGLVRPGSRVPFPTHALPIPELSGLFEANGRRVVRVLGKPVFCHRLQLEMLEKLLDADEHIEVAGLKVR
jgi:hypothetical protein